MYYKHDKNFLKTFNISGVNCLCILSCTGNEICFLIADKEWNEKYDTCLRKKNSNGCGQRMAKRNNPNEQSHCVRFSVKDFEELKRMGRVVRKSTRSKKHRDMMKLATDMMGYCYQDDTDGEIKRIMNSYPKKGPCK